jgi:hypothetical protein
MLHVDSHLLLEKITTLWQEVDRRFSAFAQAIRANSEKVEPMTRDISRDYVSYSIVEVLLRGDSEIPHHAAVFTHKMIVLIHCCIISMKSLSEIEFLDFSLSCEDVEVSIHCAKRNAGHLRTDLFIHPFRSWMSNGLF